MTSPTPPRDPPRDLPRTTPHMPPHTSASTTPRTTLDHITITSPTLAAGAALVQQALGVAMQPGGEHPRMATHNLLLRLGDDAFLEVIAPNPQAAAPARPRWFALDTMRADSPPALTNWVARTPDIAASLAAATAMGEALGPAEPMSRGALDWLITFPADGSLPLGGAAPGLIAWHTPTPPATRLPDQGLALQQLVLHHPEPARVQRLLAALGFDGPVAVVAGDRPGLSAHITTPHGLRVLGL